MNPYSNEWKEVSTLEILSTEEQYMKSRSKRHTYYCQNCKCYAKYLAGNLNKGLEFMKCLCCRTTSSREANFMKHMHLISEHYYCRQSDHFVDGVKMSMDFVLIPKAEENVDPFTLMENKELEFVFIEILDNNHIYVENKKERDRKLGAYLLKEYPNSKIAYVNINDRMLSDELIRLDNLMAMRMLYKSIRSESTRLLFFGKSHKVYESLLRSLV